MSKELKALKELKRQIGSIHYHNLTNMFPVETTLLLRDSEPFKTVEKAIKALEIIKRELKYNVDFVDASDFHVYIDGMICCENKEEYDLLKEVLCSNSADKDMINNTFGLD